MHSVWMISKYVCYVRSLTVRQFRYKPIIITADIISLCIYRRCLFQKPEFETIRTENSNLWPCHGSSFALPVSVELFHYVWLLIVAKFNTQTDFECRRCTASIHSHRYWLFAVCCIFAEPICAFISWAHCFKEMEFQNQYSAHALLACKVKIQFLLFAWTELWWLMLICDDTSDPTPRILHISDYKVVCISRNLNRTTHTRQMARSS